jgi:hypothetical protein
MAAPAYATAPTPMRRSRPIGVAILSVLIGIYGFIVFLLGLLIVVGSTVLGSLGKTNLFGNFGVGDVTGGLILLIIGLIILGLAVGLWHLRMWALVLTILFLVVEMIIYGLASDFVSFGFIVAVLLFIYLLAVSRHFS